MIQSCQYMHEANHSGRVHIDITNNLVSKELRDCIDNKLSLQKPSVALILALRVGEIKKLL